MSAPRNSVIDRELPTDESRSLLDFTSELVRGELLSRADKAEETGDFPRDIFAVLGQAGLLGLPYPRGFLSDLRPHRRRRLRRPRAVGLSPAGRYRGRAGRCPGTQDGTQGLADLRGVGFLLADAATGIDAARLLYLAAARRKDAGLPFSAQAAMAKLTATDMCMKVTTDMVQVLGGAGYVQDYPLERFMREAKVLQILEGTNQIQRTVILKSLVRASGTAR